jgi:dihydrolipoamide dehydrogenase
MAQKYDIVIIGSGPGGYVAAIRAAQLGAQVALVEKDLLGGTCLNWGCIPSKAMAHDAELYRQAVSGEFGLDVDGEFKLNFGRLMQRKQNVVTTLREGIARLMEGHKIAVLQGMGRILAPGLVQVTGAEETSTLETRNILIATGSVPAQLPLPGSDLPGVMTSDGIFELTHLPKSLVVIGAGVIGVEFACIFHALGSQVSVLDNEVFLGATDQQLAKRMRALLSQRGMQIAIGANCQCIERTPEGLLQVRYEWRGKSASAEGEIVLISVGRCPYTEGLGLAEAGVQMDGRAIVVDDHMQTNIPGIYAIGDCVGKYMLAHVASYEGQVAVENMLGRERKMDYRVVPAAIFTMPEIADVGLTEEQAKQAGLAVKVSRFPFAASSRALTMGEPEGQIRMVCEDVGGGRGGRVLGVHIMGPRASDMIAEVALAMRLGATAEDIAHTIHTHPTMPEAMMEAAMAQLDGAIHFQTR